MKNRSINPGPAVSIVVCVLLLLVGLIRLLSYSRGAVGDVICHSPLGPLCYDPGSVVSAQFFKILATPSVIALIYFYFRWRNSGVPSYPSERLARANRLDFQPMILRGILTSVVTVHWLAMEWWKFNVEGFYPWSELEHRAMNIGVLLVSQALAFWSMKYLSFEPVFKPFGTSHEIPNP